MLTGRAYIYCAVFVLSLSGVIGQTCTSANNCPCGSVCVDVDTSRQCGGDNSCTCRQGCFVFNTFLTEGDGAKWTHGNSCSCRDPVRSNSIPRCTRRAWYPVPNGVSVHVKNPNCDVQQQGR